MKKLCVYLLLGCLCAFILLTAGCKAKDDTTYYELEDFKDIIIGQTSLEEVHNQIPSPKAWIGNLGMFFSYPMEDGRWIIVMFDSKEQTSEETEYVVKSIEIWDDFGDYTIPVN